MPERLSPIVLLKKRLAEQQVQLDKLRRMNICSRSEKVVKRIAQIEAQLTAMKKDIDECTGRVDDTPVPRPLRQI